ncbi:MAG: GNAT family N-acetyltransferase [Pseudomonadota bacterium]
MAHVLFETARLRARQLRPDDLLPMLAVYGDDDAMRWVGDGHALTQAQCAEWLDVTDSNLRLRGYGMSALVERGSDEVVGFCGLVHPGGQPEAEIKYALKRAHWGRGLATEAATAMLAYGAGAHGIGLVIATATPANIASHRVLLKAGMVASALRSNADGSQTQVFAWRAPPAALAEHIRALERSRLQALVERDMTRARQLHAPDFQLVTPGGRAFTRDQYLGKIESGVLRYLRWEPGAIEVRMQEASAVIRYQATLEIDAGEGHGTPFQCWHIDAYELGGAGWQVVWSQATAIK